jgi:hypothetical protein
VTRDREATASVSTKSVSPVSSEVVMRLHVRHLIAMLTVVTILAHGEGIARGADEPKWSIYGSDYYQLLYRLGHEEDARKVKGFLDAAIAALKKEFAEFPVDELLRVNCVIYLHPARTEKASEHTVTITTGQNNGKYHAVIDLLAPSAYDRGYRSNINEPAGDDYIHKLVVHEYSTVLLERITRAKKAGWSFFNAPRWFVDGYEEYLALMLSSPRNRGEVLGKYLAMHKGDRQRIGFDFGISVKDDYVDGALLLLFMHETFGSKRVHAILTSEQRSFGTAMASSLGVGLEEFQKRWDEWLRKKLK